MPSYFMYGLIFKASQIFNPTNGTLRIPHICCIYVFVTILINYDFLEAHTISIHMVPFNMGQFENIPAIGR